MPKPKYIRKTTRQSWEEEHMKNAMTEVIAGRMGYYKASKRFNVPQSTLEARVAKVRKLGVTIEEASKKGKHNICDTLFQIH